jgi:hypothetical protein
VSGNRTGDGDEGQMLRVTHNTVSDQDQSRWLTFNGSFRSGFQNANNVLIEMVWYFDCSHFGIIKENQSGEEAQAFKELSISFPHLFGVCHSIC